MEKRGQITIFVILGLMFLFVIVFILYAVSISNQSRLEDQADSIIHNYIESTSLDSYVTYCLDQVTDNGIETIFSQGLTSFNGQSEYSMKILPENQGQTYLPFLQNQILDNGTLYRKKINVSYGVVQMINCPHFVPPIKANFDDEQTSYYPVRQTWFDEYKSKYNSLSALGGCLPTVTSYATYSGFLGNYNLPALCSYDGVNSNGELYSFCGPYQYDFERTKNSFQRQLESYIEINMPLCTNFTYFERRGANVTPNFDEINATVYFNNPTGLTSSVSYTFNATLARGQVLKREAFFTSEVDGLFKQMHNYLQTLLMESLKNPYFSIEKNWNNETLLKSYVSSFQLLKREKVCLFQGSCTDSSSFNDDIYTLVDTSSTINGRPITINFAVQNRKPILDYIHDRGYSNRIAGQLLDKQYYTNGTLLLEPFAVDPDDDNISYSYKGWREDYYEVLDLEACDEAAYPYSCNLSNHKEFLDKIGILEGDKLTDSSLFISTNRSVKKDLNDSDMGYHNITVIVTDEHGFQDFQIVKILVFDMPRAVLNISNNFDDINNNSASIEDFYTLSGANSVASSFMGGELSNLTFLVENKDGEIIPFIISDKQEIISLPNQTYDHTNITIGYYTLEALGGETSIFKNVTLIVEQGPVSDNSQDPQTFQSTPVISTVELSECLPHGYSAENEFLYGYSSNKNLINLAYPYSGSFATAPHVCCVPFEVDRTENLTGGSFAKDGRTCFKTSFLTVYPFKQFENLAYDDDILLENDDENPGVLSSGKEEFLSNLLNVDFGDDGFNDIYSVDLDQSCSGNRGNVCSGEFDLTITTNEHCVDITNPDVNRLSVGNNYQFARCQSPNKNNQGHDYFLNELYCYDLNGPSFEKNILDSSFSVYVSIDDLHLSSDREKLLEEGYCGDENNFNFVTGDGLRYYVGGAYSCKPSCDRELGCSYTKYWDCSCEKGDAECDGLTLDSFNIVNKQARKYQEVNNLDGVCDSSCNYHGLDTIEGCYYEVHHDLDIQSSYEFKLRQFYENSNYKIYNLDSGVEMSNTMCCTNDVVITETSPGFDGSLCYGGVVYTENKLLTSKLLYCDKDGSEEIYSCGDSPFKYVSKTISNTQNYCGYVCDSRKGEWNKV